MITVRGSKSSAATRRVPVEPSFRPLLELLLKEAGDGALVNVPRADGKGGTSNLMRLDLEAAGLARASSATTSGTCPSPSTGAGTRRSRTGPSRDARSTLLRMYASVSRNSRANSSGAAVATGCHG